MARQRRHQARRRRRGRFRGLYQFLSVLLVAAAVLAACLIFFRVNSVLVEGNERYTAEEIIAASGIQNGESLVALSKGRAASLIRTGLPYVESVSIHRKYPDTVVLTVKERAAVATVTGSGGCWLISSQGKLLEEHSGQQVIEIVGLSAVSPFAGSDLQVAEEKQLTLSNTLELLTALEERELLALCTRLDCTDTVSMTLSYDIYELKFPHGGDFAYMLRLLQAALENEKMPQGVPGVFDFTVKEGEVFFRASQ